MYSKTQLQTAELIKRNFSRVLQEQGVYVYGTEPLVTVTEVTMSPDLGNAKIYLSVYNVDDKETVLFEINQSITELRKDMAKKIRNHVRRIPVLDVYLDETLDEVKKLDSIFDKINRKN